MVVVELIGPATVSGGGLVEVVDVGAGGRIGFEILCERWKVDVRTAWYLDEVSK